MTRKTLIRLIQLLFFVLAGVVIWYLLHKMSAENRASMLNGIKSTRIWMLVPVFAAGLLSHWARARRWRLLLEPLSIRPTTTNTLFAVLVGYLVNMIPPRAGEVAKCTILAEYEKVPADKMIGTVVTERVFDVISLFIVILTGVIWQRPALSKFWHYLMADPGRAAAIHETALAIAILGMLILVLLFVHRRNNDSRMGRFINGLSQGANSIFKLRHKGAFLGYTVLIWAMYLLEILLGFLAMPATQHLGIGVGWVTLIAGSFAIIISPGGVGLYPLFVSFVLTTAYTLDSGAATAYAWVSWAAQTVMVILFGVASLILLPFYNRRQHNAQASVD